MNIVKLIKFILIAFVSIVVFAISAGIILVVFVNPNRFKPVITELVKENTGRTFELQGDIKWKLFPVFGLHIGHAVFSNPENFLAAAPQLASIDGIDIAVQIMPLFNKHIIVDKIIVNGLDLSLVQQANNRLNNWSFDEIKGIVKVTKSSNAPTGAGNAYYSKNTQNMKNIKHDIKLVSNTNEATGYAYPTKSLPVAKQIKLKLNEITIRNSSVSYTKYNGETRVFAKKINKLNFRLTTQLGGAINFSNEMLVLNKVKFNFNDIIKGTLNLQVKDVTTNLNYNGKIDLKSFSANKLLQVFAIQLPNTINKKILDNIQLQSDFKGDKGSLLISAAKLQMGDIFANIKFKVNSFHPLHAQDVINIDKINLAEFVDLQGFNLLIDQIAIAGNIDAKQIKQAISAEQVTLLGFDARKLLHHVSNVLVDTEKVISMNPLEHIDNLNKIVNLVNNIQILYKQMTKNNKGDYKQKTDLGDATINLTYKDGVLSPSNLLLDGPVVKISGSGGIDFAKNKLSYKVNTRVAEKYESEALNILVFPCYLHGSLDKPKVNLDWDSVKNQLVDYYINKNRSNLEREVKREINKQLKDATESVKKGVDSLLKDIFK